MFTTGVKRIRWRSALADTMKEQIRIGDNMKKKFDEAITLDHNYFRMKTLN